MSVSVFLGWRLFCFSSGVNGVVNLRFPGESKFIDGVGTFLTISILVSPCIADPLSCFVYYDVYAHTPPLSWRGVIFAASISEGVNSMTCEKAWLLWRCFSCCEYESPRARLNIFYTLGISKI